MNTYLLFCGEDYYPAGGWGDFEDFFSSIEDALAHLEKQSQEAYRHNDWAHIVKDREIVLSLAKNGGKWIEIKKED